MMKIPVFHRNTGHVAFWYEKDKISPGKTICCEFAQHVDGSAIKAGDEFRCGTCGKRLSPKDLEPRPVIRYIEP